MKVISVAEVVHAAEFDPKPPAFWAGFTWFAPAVAMRLAVTLYPTGMVRWLSVHRTRLYEVVDGVGLASYASVLTSLAFVKLTFGLYRYRGLKAAAANDPAPAAAALEVRTRYVDALAKS